MTDRTDLLPEPLLGPDFGSYHRDDVRWLLTDLSWAALEAPTAVREKAVQLEGAHYAESLPIEYEPSAEYQQAYLRALSRSRRRIAEAVGTVTELVLAERGPNVVLASLARAGTPIGVLMRRWAWQFHGLDLPHYAVSIVRGRGLDPVAIDYLAAHHRPDDVVFVDGWTGKGAITRELEAAVAQVNEGRPDDARFRSDLVVLADTGRCVRSFGTREDFLIPSACLNSTVSGLVSRTVVNKDLIGPGQFHGAKFYAELASADVSAQFIDAIVGEFESVFDDVRRAGTAVREGDRTPTWTGWEVVRELGRIHGIDDPNLIKPGVGETTRVLLRRVPWKVLIRPQAHDELEHVILLAEQRGVEVEPVADLTYKCVGLIRPARRTPPVAAGPA